MARPMVQHKQAKTKAAQSQAPNTRALGLWAGLHIAAIVLLVVLAVGQARAEAPSNGARLVAETATLGFAAHCFNPRLTGDLAQARLASEGVRVDFYDLRPFSNVAISPANGRAVTAGTDRRCEVAFDGSFAPLAAQAALSGLTEEGILTEAALPDSYTALPGTELLAARQLNPNRVAVVHAGTRPHHDGTETFIFVERLVPSDE